jgi:ubiquinone/menaquinone biosynthesis C-methylase UbiE
MSHPEVRNQPALGAWATHGPLDTSDEDGVMSESERGQVASDAAEVYEAFFIPALFGQWPDRLLAAADVGLGDRVLDVGCGTGILARGALSVVGETGHVVGVDPNAGMLTVARRSSDRVEWVEGAAERLPFEDDRFDRVVSQFALMFFTNREAAIGEMARVLRPGGRVAVATWAPLDESPGYAAMVRLLRRLFGEPAAQALRAPYALGEHAQVRALLERAFDDVVVATVPGVARFESIEAWVHTDIRGWTLADLIDDDQYETLLREARRELASFRAADGSVCFDAPALIGTGRNRA